MEGPAPSGPSPCLRSPHPLGHVVGYSTTRHGTKFFAPLVIDAFLFANGAMNDLGALPGGTGIASAVNDAGVVVGYSATATSSQHAFLYSNGSMTDLGTLPGGQTSSATSINNNGDVVGVSQVNGHPRAFLFQQGSMTDIGTLGGNDSRALDINDAGHIVGHSTTPSGEQHAFLYADGSMTDLNSLLFASHGWTLRNAAAINDHGQFVGYGTNSAGKTRAFLLTTPDPSFFRTSSPRLHAPDHFPSPPVLTVKSKLGIILRGGRAGLLNYPSCRKLHNSSLQFTL